MEEEGCVTLEEARGLVASSRRILVVSGSGISASAGLSTYVNGGGVYERARKRYKLAKGIELFNWSFYEERPRESQAFLAQLAGAVAGCEPTATHRSIVALERAGTLVRHVTMNIDSLHSAAGGSLWHGRDGAGRSGKTVELHGALREVVDVVTGDVYAADETCVARLRAKRDAFPARSDPPPAPLFGAARDGRKRPRAASEADDQADEDGDEDDDADPPLRFRFRVMLYGDAEHDRILDGGAALARLDDDAREADLVLWLGISFEQAASCEYLRRVEAALAGAPTPQLLVNPCPEALFAARSALDTPSDVDLRALKATSDALFAANAAPAPDDADAGDGERPPPPGKRDPEGVPS